MDMTHVEVLHDHVVRLRFADGTDKTIDLDPYLHDPVFAAIRDDPAAFAAVSVDPDAGTIVWPNGADLAPDTLYTAPPVGERGLDDLLEPLPLRAGQEPPSAVLDRLRRDER
jgi:hypothetical protein